MIDSPLIALFRSFGRKEMTRFRDFCFSPYWNKHQGVRSLIAYLNDQYPNFSTQHCSGEMLWQAIGEKGVVDKKALSMIFTYTQRLALDFLAAEKLKQKSQQTVSVQLEELRNRKQYKLYNKVKKNQNKLLSDPEVRDSHFFLQKSKSFQEENALLNQRGKYGDGELLSRKLDMLDRFYLIEKLKDACELFQRAQVQKQKFISPLNDFALQEINTNISQYSDAAPLVIYFHIYQMLVNNRNEDFYQARSSINQYKSDLSFEDKNSTYNFLLNFCIKRINEGEIAFRREAFDLYKMLLEEELLIISNILPEWHYKNLVTLGLLVDEIQWTQGFVEEYKALLSKESRENAYNYNLATLYYKTKNYKELYPLLLRVEYTDWRYALDAKVLLLKAYYDTRESEALNSLYDSFRQYIKRNKAINDFQRQSYNNLIKFTHRVFNLLQSKGFTEGKKVKAESEKLFKEIQETTHCFNKSWILDKLREVA